MVAGSPMETSFCMRECVPVTCDLDTGQLLEHGSVRDEGKRWRRSHETENSYDHAVWFSDQLERRSFDGSCVLNR